MLSTEEKRSHFRKHFHTLKSKMKPLPREQYTGIIALLQAYLRVEQMCVNHGSFDIVQVSVVFKSSL